MATSDSEPESVKLPDEIDVLCVMISGFGPNFWVEHGWKLYWDTVEDMMTGGWYFKWLEALRNEGIVPDFENIPPNRGNEG